VNFSRVHSSAACALQKSVVNGQENYEHCLYSITNAQSCFF